MTLCELRHITSTPSPQRNLNPKSQSCKWKSQKPISNKPIQHPPNTQNQENKHFWTAQRKIMPNLTTYLKYHWWIPRLPKRVKFKEKKCTNTKKSQQTISTPIFIKLEIGHLISSQKPRLFNELPRCKNSASPWNYYFPKYVGSSAMNAGQWQVLNRSEFLYH